MPPLFNMNVFKKNCYNFIDIEDEEKKKKLINYMKVRYWVKEFFIKYGVITKKKNDFRKNYNAISEFLLKLTKIIDDEEKNGKYSKLFIPSVEINDFNKVEEIFTRKDLVLKKLKYAKIHYWLKHMTDLKMIKEKKQPNKREALFEKIYGNKFSNWMEKSLIAKVKRIERESQGLAN